MKPVRKQIADILRHVDDPELGVNIVDLGLIYDLRFDDGDLRVALTMTTPACPLSDYIKKNIRHVTGQVKHLESVQVEVVWQPPRSPKMMDPAVRQKQSRRPQYPPQYT
jgi:metal-sulfur cluster biosynthetic enzyme